MILVLPLFYFCRGGLLGSFNYLYFPFFLFLMFNINNFLNTGLFVLSILTILLVVLAGGKYPEFFVPVLNIRFQFLYFSINIFFDIILVGLIVLIFKQKVLFVKQKVSSIFNMHKSNTFQQKTVQNRNITLLSLLLESIRFMHIKNRANLLLNK